MKNQNKKRHILGKILTLVMMLAVTAFAGVGVVSAVQQNHIVAAKTEFIADNNVECDINIYVNDNKIGETIIFIANQDSKFVPSVDLGSLSNYWIDPDIEDNYIEKQIEVKVVITNNSEKSELSVTPKTTYTGSVINCDVVDMTNGVIAKGESKEFVCTYAVKDINKDVAEFNTSWAFTLEQAQ